MSQVPGATQNAVHPSPTAWAEALPSWRDGPARRTLLDFVARVTTPGGPDYVEADERIAVFDNDGTLWTEQPMYFQLQFVLDDVARRATEDPGLAGVEPYRSVLARDMAALRADGNKVLMQAVAITQQNLTTQAYAARVHAWIDAARHPRTQRLLTQMVYQPQLELLALLERAGFRTFIVSGGGVEFLRVFAKRVYHIPPERVVGSSCRVTFRMTPQGKPELTLQPGMEFVDEGPGKPIAINRSIGHRPILACGNSDGDLEMLQYVAGGPGPHLALLVHHTDAEREWAYDRQSPVGTLDKALDEARRANWTVIDMQQDWNVVFP